MSEELYCRTCKDCQKIFRTDQRNKQYCPSCIKRRRNEYSSEANCRKSVYKKRGKKKPILSMTEVIHIIEVYNKEHGTCYTYGKFPPELLQKTKGKQINGKV